jgi:AraC family transcriptional activator of pobA
LGFIPLLGASPLARPDLPVMTPENAVVPSCFLFGEPPRAVSDRFLHLEALDDRSRPSHWHIRAHAHADLNHVFFIDAGGGTMTAEARAVAFGAPCLIIVPAGVVHGFAFAPETTGRVLTVAGSYLRELAGREGAFADLFGVAACLPLPDPAAVAGGLARLERELAWKAPGHGAAVESHLLAILVEAVRLSRQNAAVAPGPDRSAARLVARFRALVETAYMSGDPIDAYAARLGVSATRLRRACQGVAGVPPIRLIHDRLLLEAKRVLLYSNLTVNETAYRLGIDDPAYFSRLFKKREGVAPHRFRQAAARRIIAT